MTPTRDTRKRTTTSTTRRTAKKTSALNNVEVYLLCNADKPTRKKPERLHHLLGKKWQALEEHTSEHPVFLDQRNALRYCRFLGEKHIVLKAYIPESAIAGSSDECFVLKQGALTKQRVHGGFTEPHHQSPYLENIHFDPEHLPEIE